VLDSHRSCPRRCLSARLHPTRRSKVAFRESGSRVSSIRDLALPALDESRERALAHRGRPAPPGEGVARPLLGTSAFLLKPTLHGRVQRRPTATSWRAGASSRRASRRCRASLDAAFGSLGAARWWREPDMRLGGGARPVSDLVGFSTRRARDGCWSPRWLRLSDSGEVRGAPTSGGGRFVARA
jgi:hypothetical protein